MIKGTSSAVICFIGIESKIYAKHFLQTFTCSMSVIKTCEKRCEICSKAANIETRKKPE